MISYKDSLEIINRLPIITQYSTKPLDEAHHHILAEDLRAPFDAPLFSNSAMDGVGFRFQDRHNGSLKISSTIYAGGGATIPYKENHCVKIMTGAPVPDWVDTVVPIEQTNTDNNEITFKNNPVQGSHIRKAGEDIRRGEKLLACGSWLTPEAMMIAANFGHGQLHVRSRPRILVYYTGDELLEPGAPVQDNHIYNSSGAFLAAGLGAYHLKPAVRAWLPDDPKTAMSQISSDLGAQNEPTLIITTGAVSAGERDFIPGLAADLGFCHLFHRVAVRPGKPVLLASKDNGQTLWLGLPGNPLSTATGWHFFAREILRHWAGFPLKGRTKARIINDVEKPDGLTCFFRGLLKDGQVHIHNKQGSAHLKASIESNVYVVLPGQFSNINAGTFIDVQTI